MSYLNNYSSPKNVRSYYNPKKKKGAFKKEIEDI